MISTTEPRETHLLPGQHLHRFGLRYFVDNNWSGNIGGAFSFTRTSFTKENDEFAKEFVVAGSEL